MFEAVPSHGEVDVGLVPLHHSAGDGMYPQCLDGSQQGLPAAAGLPPMC